MMKPRPLVLAIAAIGTALSLDALAADGAPMERPNLEERFAAVAPRDPELHLRAERTTQYEKVADILAAAQKAGINKIAFVTEPNR